MSGLFGEKPSRYTGKERDAESGLDYFGARYYGSNMGRFMSPDWSDETDPVPYADLSNPQSLNLYGYVGNNPLTMADPDGHDGEDEDEGGDPQQAGAIPLAAPMAVEVPSIGEMVVGAIAACPIGLGAALVFGPALAYPRVTTDCACLTPAQQAAFAAAHQNSLVAMAPHKTLKGGSKKKSHNKHTKVRPGAKKPPNYEPHREFERKTDNKPKEPYFRKDRDFQPPPPPPPPPPITEIIKSDLLILGSDWEDASETSITKMLNGA